jgi:hypothetical protein
MRGGALPARQSSSAKIHPLMQFINTCDTIHRKEFNEHSSAIDLETKLINKYDLFCIFMYLLQNYIDYREEIINIYKTLLINRNIDTPKRNTPSAKMLFTDNIPPLIELMNTIFLIYHKNNLPKFTFKLIQSSITKEPRSFDDYIASTKNAEFNTDFGILEKLGIQNIKIFSFYKENKENAIDLIDELYTKINQFFSPTAIVSSVYEQPVNSIPATPSTSPYGSLPNLSDSPYGTASSGVSSGSVSSRTSSPVAVANPGFYAVSRTAQDSNSEGEGNYPF